MFEFKFEYKVAYRPVRKVSRPFLVPAIKYGCREMSYPVLVDSGADNIILPGEVAEHLKIDLVSLPLCNIRTFWGSVAHKGPKVEFSFPDLNPRVSFNCGVLFSPDLQGFQFGLLGREAFESIRYCFTHEYREDAFYLSFL